MSRECGTCSMCCKIPSIEELSKPAETWCQHCKPGKGCMIYENRPEVCREYICYWLMAEDVVPDWMKPSESRILLDETTITRNGVEESATRACLAEGFRHVVKPGTPQRTFLDQLSSWRPLVVDVTPTERFVIQDGTEFPVGDPVDHPPQPSGSSRLAEH